MAEDNAIEDTVYHLHRALDTGSVDLERFLRVSSFLPFSFRVSFFSSSSFDPLLLFCFRRRDLCDGSLGTCALYLCLLPALHVLDWDLTDCSRSFALLSLDLSLSASFRALV